MRWGWRWRRARRELYERGWSVNMLVNMVNSLLFLSIGLLFESHRQLALLLLVLFIVGIALWLLFGLRPPQLLALVLRGGMERRGLNGGQTRWDWWLEIVLIPREGQPATLLPQPLQGVLQIHDLRVEHFDAVALETQYSVPPDTLRLLDGREDRLPPLRMTETVRLLLAATCLTPLWDPSLPSGHDSIRVVMEFADDEYAPVNLTARLQRGPDLTTWRVV